MAQVHEQKAAAGSQTKHTLPELPHDFGALEPYIETQTMQIHHGKHHQAYVTNLNNALNKHPELLNNSLEDLRRGISSFPDAIRTAVRNDAGDHHHHTLSSSSLPP